MKTKKQKINILFKLFIVLGFLFFSNSVFASINLSVSPQKFDITVFPGESENFQIRLKNRSQIYLPITAKVVPFGASEISGDISFKERVPDGPHNWVTFERDNFILAPNQEERVRFNVKVPTNTNPGGYYLFLYFEPRVPSFGANLEGPKLIPVIGVPFLISTDDLVVDRNLKEVAEITEFGIEKSSRNTFLERQLGRLPFAFASDSPSFYITKKMPDKFLVNIKNNDLYHINPEGTLVIKQNGKEVAKGELQGETILPGNSRQFEIMISEFETTNLLANTGRYTAEFQFTGESPIRDFVLSVNNPTISFFNLPLLYWMILAVSTLFVIGFRKRLKLIFWWLINPDKIKLDNKI